MQLKKLAQFAEWRKKYKETYIKNKKLQKRYYELTYMSFDMWNLICSIYC